MHSNKLWALFLFVILVITISYGVETIYQIWNQARLAQKHPARVEAWEIEEDEKQHFAPLISYSFTKGEEKIQKRERLESETFKNPYLVKNRIEELKGKQWSVFCDPKDPHSCTIQKVFPMKRAIYTLILIGLSFYFIYLGRYVAKWKS